MNYYYRFPGDYARDTKHLSLVEHGAYTLLLDTLYATEKPLPGKEEILFRVCNATTKRQRNAVKNVLSEFFFRKRMGFSNKRFEKELKRVRIKAYIAGKNGKKGGRPSKKKTQRKPRANPAKSYPQPQPHTTPQKSSPNVSFSNGSSIAAAVKVSPESTATAFSAIGFEEPFGQPTFQRVWLQNHKLAKAQGTWLTIAMERTIQECNSKDIRVPPQFFDAKRTVEAAEDQECKQKYHRTPL